MRYLIMILLASGACTETPTNPVCGNGSVEAGEACDDGNAVDTDACSSACVAARCGDGVVQEGELCEGSEAEGCYSCQPRCGDGIAALNLIAVIASVVGLVITVITRLIPRSDAVTAARLAAVTALSFRAFAQLTFLHDPIAAARSHAG